MIAAKCQEQWRENLELICVSEPFLFHKVIMQLRGWRALAMGEAFAAWAALFDTWVFGKEGKKHL